MNNIIKHLLELQYKISSERDKLIPCINTAELHGANQDGVELLDATVSALTNCSIYVKNAIELFEQQIEDGINY